MDKYRISWNEFITSWNGFIYMWNDPNNLNSGIFNKHDQIFEMGWSGCEMDKVIVWTTRINRVYIIIIFKQDEMGVSGNEMGYANPIPLISMIFEIGERSYEMDMVGAWQTWINIEYHEMNL